MKDLNGKSSQGPAHSSCPNELPQQAGAGDLSARGSPPPSTPWAWLSFEAANPSDVLRVNISQHSSSVSLPSASVPFHSECVGAYKWTLPASCSCSVSCSNPSTFGQVPLLRLLLLKARAHTRLLRGNHLRSPELSLAWLTWGERCSRDSQCKPGSLESWLTGKTGHLKLKSE